MSQIIFTIGMAMTVIVTMLLFTCEQRKAAWRVDARPLGFT